MSDEVTLGTFREPGGSDDLDAWKDLEGLTVAQNVDMGGLTGSEGLGVVDGGGVEGVVIARQQNDGLGEGGQDFELAWWNGDAWEITADGTTNNAGYYTWYDLEPGEYWLDEQDREWCHLSSDWLSDDGNWLNVYEGEETVVKIYNCTGEPGKPGKTPTKYPNTGVPMREEWRLTA